MNIRGHSFSSSFLFDLDDHIEYEAFLFKKNVEQPILFSTKFNSNSFWKEYGDEKVFNKSISLADWSDIHQEQFEEYNDFPNNFNDYLSAGELNHEK